ncbi:beta-1,3-galactosyltransferase 5 [Strongylocentrotus purpuratus]|uniref:Hexosyltransferase n=1 Tax=Strongylocentrotus purpuratus TaxID=7668 RepID=A0A7M7GK60_STRPU|nr:beta-1,3-galactosyltransferase 5 [Strongylocentrotus purpuratus]
MMIDRWLTSRTQFKFYSLGLMNGVLFVYSLSQLGHVVRMKERIQTKSFIPGVPSNSQTHPIPIFAALMQNVSYYVTPETADGVVIRQERYTRPTTAQLHANRKIDEEKPGYLNEPTDAHDYNYIHNPSNTCFKKDGRKLDVIVLFFSPTAPYHFSRRQAIRATYGNSSQWISSGRKGAMLTVFLLGATSNATLQREIDSEATRYGDIVQEDFVDSYQNLTRKTVMGLKWVTNYCRHAQYAMKIDDDTMMNQRRFRDGVLEKAPLTNYTAGKALVGTNSVRKKESKFYLSEEYYPSPTFPPYMDGPAYLLSTDLIEKVYKTALTTPIFKWEDAFLGMCMQKAGVQIRGIEQFLLFRLRYKTNERREHTVNMYTFISNLSAAEMKWMWNIGHI